MGVSLQIYRMTIGCFDSNPIRVVSPQRDLYFKTKKCRKLTILKILRSLLLFATILVFGLVVINSIYKTARNLSTFEITRNLLTADNRFVDYNFLARYKFGNKSKNGLKLSHINIGGGYLLNKVNEIELVISQEQPHVLGISEASIHIEQDLNDFKIDHYTLCYSETLMNPSLNVSRVCVLVHESVITKVRHDLMDNWFSSV